ncbi:MAG: hypothetical protein ACN6RH_12505, partial [Stenotrophomonas rhizophila]
MNRPNASRTATDGKLCDRPLRRDRSFPPPVPPTLPFRELFAMQKPAVTVMVKAARLAGNVLLRNINKL